MFPVNDNGPWHPSIPDGRDPLDVSVWVCNEDRLIEITRGSLRMKIRIAKLIARVLNLAGAVIPGPYGSKQ